MAIIAGLEMSGNSEWDASSWQAVGKRCRFSGNPMVGMSGIIGHGPAQEGQENFVQQGRNE